jgi:hypothetical protein
VGEKQAKRIGNTYYGSHQLSNVISGSLCGCRRICWWQVYYQLGNVELNRDDALAALSLSFQDI